jgi:signal transduction histidine kinase
LYFITGRAGLRFAFVHPSSTSIWPPTGIAFAAVLLMGYRIWPAIFAAAFMVNIATAGGWATSLGIATGNTLEAVVGVYLVNRFAGGVRVFERARDVFKFALLAGALSTMVSATLGVSSLALGGVARWSNYGAIWLTWWLGDASGDLVVAPLIVLWIVPRSAAGRIDRHWAEAIALPMSVLIIGLFVFGGLLPAGTRNYALEFLCIPALVWTSFRFGPRESATVVAMLSVIAAWGTLHGLGPFARHTPNESFLLLQAFIATMAIMTLPMACLVRERIEIEGSERRAREAAEAANRSKDEFMAMLAHELRNPLSAIGSAARVLDHSRAGAERIARAKAIILRQSEHLARLVEDLLDIGRSGAGRIVLYRRPTNLADCVIECINALTQGEKAASHEIRTELQPVWVEGDPDRLEQIVANLLTNAIKYTPEGGTIRVSTRADGGSALIQVVDSGVGISAELLPRIFDLFFQGNAGFRQSRSGMGIGLALVRRLAELHGGTVEAASAGENRGSTFTIRLPRIEAPGARTGAIARSWQG